MQETKTLREITPTGSILAQLPPISLPKSDSEFAARQPDFDCSECLDTGFVYVETEYRGKPIKEPKRCECRERRIRAAKIAAMPAEYRHCELKNLTPRTDLHPRQAEFIRLLKANPSGKFVISGDFGTGKTHFFWALYREAVERGRKTYAGTLRALINEYQKAIELAQAGERYNLPITADELKQNHTPYALFLDDIDKARPTEYVAEQLFEIIDAAYSFSHQIVVTTNLPVDNLLEHFRRADKEFGRFGGAIVRRLLDAAIEIEMF